MRDLVASNIDALLEAGDVGVYLAEIYAAAMQVLPPDVRAIAVKTGDDFAKYDRVECAVSIHTTEGWSYYERLLNSPGKLAAELAFRHLEVELVLITPKMLVAQIFLHEFGHGYSHLVFKDSDTHLPDRSIQLDSLPVPGLYPSQLERWLKSKDGKTYWQENKSFFKRNHGVHSARELVVLQRQHYRKLPDELFADKFAATALKAIGRVYG